MSDDEGLTPGDRRRRPSLAPASPLENEDTLSEILLLLAPAPSSLTRASVVCKLWRRLVTDPGFLRRFRARHRRDSPLLGFFAKDRHGLFFAPTLDPPDRIPPGYFSMQLDDAHGLGLRWGWGLGILCCRHGLVLIYSRRQHQLLVWDPVTGDRPHGAVPPEFLLNGDMSIFNGAVLSGVNGGGRSSNFKVVLASNDLKFARACACVYSSDTGIWGNLISSACPSMVLTDVPSVLVGGSLYWLLEGDSRRIRILEFDLDRQCLAVTTRDYELQFRVMRAEGGVLGFLFLSSFSIQLWKRETDCDGGAGWVLGRTIDLHTLLSLGSDDEEWSLTIFLCGFAEDNNVLLLRTKAGAFLIQLEPMQSDEPFGMRSSRLIRDRANFGDCDNLSHPFTCLYCRHAHWREAGCS